MAYMEFHSYGSKTFSQTESKLLSWGKLNPVVECGVPQGSILGPLLYILYVNDMKLAVRHSTISLYADDTALYMTGNNCQELQDILQSDLNQISKWLVTNKLFLNINKTKSMLIGNRQHRDIDIPSET